MVRLKRIFLTTVVLVLACVVVACSGDTGTTSRSATSGFDPERAVADSWEEAAVAEAERLSPGLSNPRAERVDVTPMDERVRVEADGDYCHIFGGKFDSRIGWQANDLGTC